MYHSWRYVQCTLFRQRDASEKFVEEYTSHPCKLFPDYSISPSYLKEENKAGAEERGPLPSSEGVTVVVSRVPALRSVTFFKHLSQLSQRNAQCIYIFKAIHYKEAKKTATPKWIISKDSIKLMCYLHRLSVSFPLFPCKLVG